MRNIKNFQERYNRWKNGERYWDIRGIDLPKYDGADKNTQNIFQRDNGTYYASPTNEAAYTEDVTPIIKRDLSNVTTWDFVGSKTGNRYNTQFTDDQLRQMAQDSMPNAEMIPWVDKAGNKHRDARIIGLSPVDPVTSFAVENTVGLPAWKLLGRAGNKLAADFARDFGFTKLGNWAKNKIIANQLNRNINNINLVPERIGVPLHDGFIYRGFAPKNFTGAFVRDGKIYNINYSPGDVRIVNGKYVSSRPRIPGNPDKLWWDTSGHNKDQIVQVTKNDARMQSLHDALKAGYKFKVGSFKDSYRLSDPVDVRSVVQFKYDPVFKTYIPSVPGKIVTNKQSLESMFDGLKNPYLASKSKRLQLNVPTYQMYTGPRHNISEVMDTDGRINLKNLLNIQNEALQNNPGGTIARHRLENAKWHPTDWNTFLHTRDVYNRALSYNYPQEALFPTLMHDFGKMWAGDGHGPYGASIVQQIFPEASKKQIQAIYGHMDSNPIDPLTRLVKGVDIKEPNQFRTDSLYKYLLNYDKSKIR